MTPSRFIPAIWIHLEFALFVEKMTFSQNTC